MLTDLHTKDIAALCNFSSKTIEAWIRNGKIVANRFDENAPGKPRIWTPSQVVGIVIASKVYHGTERSCAPNFIHTIISTFAAYQWTSLLRITSEYEYYLGVCIGPEGRRIAIGSKLNSVERINLRTVLDQVEARCKFRLSQSLDS